MAEEKSKIKDVSTAAPTLTGVSKVLNDFEIKFKGTNFTTFKAGVVPTMEQEPKFWIPTAITPLDEIMGGGFPSSRLIEVFGPEASYKSGVVSQALECNALAVDDKGASDGVSFLYDNERTFDPSKNGLTQLPNFCYDFENVLDKFYINLTEKLKMISEVDVATIVSWDSLPATRAAEEFKAKIGEKSFGGARAAMLHSETIPRLMDTLKDASCAFAIVNQVRDSMDPDAPYDTPGGWALKFYATIRLNVEPRGGFFRWVEDSTGDPDGIMIRARTEKNKLRRPKRRADFPLVYTNNVGGCPAMAMFHWLRESKGFAKSHGGKYEVEGVPGWTFRRNFQYFYRDNVDAFLNMFEKRTGFAYSPRARRAVIKYVQELYDRCLPANASNVAA
jgi:RecA/RadA recombinase